MLPQEKIRIRASKSRFTWYDFVAYNRLTTGLQHDLGPTQQSQASCRFDLLEIIHVVGLSYACCIRQSRTM